MSNTIYETTRSEETGNYGNKPLSSEEDGQDKKTAVLEMMRQKMTGWSKVLAPFLIQNIGWFISAFLFVSGSVFVVAYTEGLVKTLIIAFSLFAYTLMIAFGAYHIRKRRPDLDTTAKVLITLSMLLIPLSILASLRLFAEGPVQSGFIAAFTLILLNLIIFYVAAKILSGMMERSLGDSHAKAFMFISAMQLGAPLINFYAEWQLLALLHFLLLASLGFILIRYNRSWFAHLFIESRPVALYAVGTLVYTTIVTFIHITWLFKEDLPSGYYGPFLMLLTGLLFYMDSSFKEITKRYTFLSKINFLFYGLSILAVVLAMGNTAAKLITLAMGTAVFAMVLRHYLTPVPLYLMFGCLGWFYGIIILEHIPKAIHFIASLPLMAGFFELHRRLSIRGSATLARKCFWLLATSFIGLAGWSLIGVAPSFATFATASVISGFSYGIVRFAPLYVFNGLGVKPPFFSKVLASEQNPQDTVLFYLTPLSFILTLAYTPQVLKAGPEWQFAMGLLIFAILWTAMGVRTIKEKNSVAARTINFTNSALSALIFSLAVISFQGPDSGNPYLHLALLLSGAIVISIAIALGMRALLYAGMFTGAVGIVLVRYTYIPWPSTGMPEMTAALCFWKGLMFLESKKSIPFFKTPLCDNGHSLKLLGIFPVEGLTPFDTIHPVLRQVIPLLWTLSIILVTRNLILHGFTISWALSAALAALSTMSLLACYKRTGFWFVPLLLGLWSATGFTHCLGYTTVIETSAAAAVYALITWIITVYLQSHPSSGKIAVIMGIETCHAKNKDTIEKVTYRTSYIVSLMAISLSLLSWTASTDAAAIIPVLTGAAFFYLSGRKYKQRTNSYFVIFGGLAGAAIIYCNIFVYSPEDLFTNTLASIFWPLAGLSLWLIVKTMECSKLAALKDMAATLYARPMREVAVLLALMAALFQIIPVNRGPISVPEIVILALSSLNIILAGRRLVNVFLNFLGVTMTSLTVFSLSSFLFEEGVRLSLWPETGGQWLTVSLLALAGAAISAKLSLNEQRYRFYGRPIRLAAIVSYTWVNLGLIPVFAAGIAAKSVPPYAPMLFLLQGLTVFPLLVNFSEAKMFRGAALAVLLTGFAVTALPFTGINWNGASIYIWALILWAGANYAVPFFNRYYPQLAFSSSLWPFIGLALFGVTYPALIAKGNLLLNWPYWLGTSLYLFLLLKNKGSFIVYHLAVAFLALSGISAAAFISDGRDFNIARFLTWAIFWTNLLFLFSRGIKRYGIGTVKRFHWEADKAASPFLAWGQLFTSLFILLLFFIDLILFIIGHVSINDLKEIFPFTGLLVLASSHLYALQKTRWNVQQILTTIFLGTLLILNAIGRPLTHLSLLLAVWGMVMMTIEHFLSRCVNNENELSRITFVIEIWTKYLPWLSLIALLAFPIASLRESILILALVTTTVALNGWKKKSEKAIFKARILGLVLLHTWPLLFLPPGKANGLYLYQVWPVLCAQFERLQVLFPWYALQLSLVILVLRRVKKRFSQNAKGTWPQLSGLFCQSFLEASIALFFLALHFVTFVQSLNPMPPTEAWISGTAALLSAAILIIMEMRDAVHGGKRQLIYALLLLAGTMLFYFRLLITGLTPLTPWDTAAIVALAYLFFILEEITRQPLLSNTLGQTSVMLPLLALFTVPFQVASPSVASVLLAAGTLYLGRHFLKGERLMLYMGVAAINAAIYLWIPVWAARSNVMQLYSVPAALSVLILLELHRSEIKPSILNNMRLASLCVLYASSSVDIFLRPEFWIFTLFLFLALAGVAAGIMLRIKVFLYSSVAFLVINVLAQLLRFYPEEGLGKGILLMACGAVIMGGMVWFNIKRESIMKKVRIYRADLARWE